MAGSGVIYGMFRSQYPFRAMRLTTAILCKIIGPLKRRPNAVVRQLAHVCGEFVTVAGEARTEPDYIWVKEPVRKK